jgi:hypothetical protein
MKIAMLVAMAATSVTLPATAHAEPTPPCSNGQGRNSRERHPYTDLRVTPPDTTETVTVPIHFDTRPLEVHPVNATP